MRKIPLKARLGSFARKEDGAIALEAMIIMPAMFWAFLMCFSIFDTFRMYSINQKAAYTVADAISRETAALDQDYLDGMRDLFEYLSASTDRGSIRVSSLWWSAADNRFYADWSHTSGSQLPLTDASVQNMTDRLPVMPNGERIVLTETWADYDPPFKTGLEEQNIRNFVFTRLRFAPQICWIEC